MLKVQASLIFRGIYNSCLAAISNRCAWLQWEFKTPSAGMELLSHSTPSKFAFSWQELSRHLHTFHMCDGEASHYITGTRESKKVSGV